MWSVDNLIRNSELCCCRLSYCTKRIVNRMR